MGRASIKENKNVYQKCREELGLTREKASELLPGIPPERIEKIEYEKSLPHPDEVMIMADGYKAPYLCNYYCANECPIGEQYVPEVKVKDLSRIVLEMLAGLNSVRKKQERLIEIAADDVLEDDEIADFVEIQEELEKLSIAIETMQLWAEQMIANGTVDAEKYYRIKKEKKE